MDELVKREGKAAEITPKSKPQPKADGFVCGDSGRVKPIKANALRLLETSASWKGVIGFDEFSGQHWILAKPPTDDPESRFTKRPLRDRDLRVLVSWVQRNGVPATPSNITEAILEFAEQAPFHPVKDYLENVAWDRTPRLETFLGHFAGVADSPLFRAWAKCWMIQAVARIFEPGCQAEAMLILEGRQGIGKSSLLKTLFGPWYADHLPDLRDKEAMIQLRGKWLIEVAELATFSRTDANRIKGFVTSRVDRFRVPYGRMAEDVPRSTVFAGTVNPGGGGYLKDPTGGRRFWPMEVTKRIDIAAITSVRDQLWAEAAHLYQGGHLWHIDDPALMALAKEAQEDRLETDPWDERIAENIEGKREVMISEILLDLGVATDRQDKRSQDRVLFFLRSRGWVRGWGHGGRKRVYRPPPQATA